MSSHIADGFSSSFFQTLEFQKELEENEVLSRDGNDNYLSFHFFLIIKQRQRTRDSPVYFNILLKPSHSISKLFRLSLPFSLSPFLSLSLSLLLSFSLLMSLFLFCGNGCNIHTVPKYAHTHTHKHIHTTYFNKGPNIHTHTLTLIRKYAHTHTVSSSHKCTHIHTFSHTFHFLLVSYCDSWHSLFSSFCFSSSFHSPDILTCFRYNAVFECCQTNEPIFCFSKQDI